MRALYGDKKQAPRLPELAENEDGKVNFTQKYTKLQENTKFKKDFEHTETILPEVFSHNGA